MNDLCDTCRTIPWRRLLTEEDTLELRQSLSDRVEWRAQIYRSDTGKFEDDESEEGAYARPQYTILELKNRGDACKLCRYAHQSITTYYNSAERGTLLWNMGAEIFSNTTARVWLSIPSRCGTPGLLDADCITVWLVDNDSKYPGPDITVCATFDSPLSNNLYQIVFPNPLHPEVQNLTLSWLSQCEEEHGGRRPFALAPSALPSRLLDIASLPSPERTVNSLEDYRNRANQISCRLVETGEEATGEQQPRKTYATLSYCWGVGLPLLTTTENFAEHKKSILFKVLPRTIQEAVLVARLLGLEWIWIDCLCIVQDDQADWEKESAMMAGIYAHGYICIRAARAKHCREGFLGDRSTNASLLQFQDEYGTLDLYFADRYDHDDQSGSHYDEPLSTRAWALQEPILAPRVLTFGMKKISYHCCNGNVCSESSTIQESIHTYSGSISELATDLQRGLAGIPRRSPPYSWDDLIERYTSCELTYERDMLPALAGVISAIQNATGDICLAGLWKRHFLEHLLWQVKSNLETAAERPKVYRAPSWSFASLKAPVRYISIFRSNMLARLVECQVTPLGLNPLGELKDGLARISGPMLTIDEVTEESSGNLGPTTMKFGHKLRLSYDVEKYTDCDILMISITRGLLLKETKEKGVYFRVGLVTDGNHPILDAAVFPEPRTITII